MSVRSTRHHTILHNTKILHTKNCFAPAYHPCKIYRCTTARFTRQHMILHNTKILHTKTFFAPACHLRNIYRCVISHFTRHHTPLHNPIILHTKIFFAPAYHLRQNISSTSKYNSNTHSSCNIHFFPFRVGVTIKVRVTVQSATRPQSVYITPRDYTNCF